MTNDSFSPGVLWWLFLAVFSPLAVAGAAHTVALAASAYKAYLWFAGGSVAFFLADRFIIQGKDDTIRIFSHEFNHAVVSLMLFKKVHSFHVEQTGGLVYHTSGGKLSTVLISLAPYCLPFFSYVLLVVRAAVIPEMYWIADVLVGVTVGFYISVFKQQIAPYQPDITQFRLRFFPYWFIFLFLIFNAGIIIYSLLPGKNVFLAFSDTFVYYWHCIAEFFN